MAANLYGLPENDPALSAPMSPLANMQRAREAAQREADALYMNQLLEIEREKRLAAKDAAAASGGSLTPVQLTKIASDVTLPKPMRDAATKQLNAILGIPDQPVPEQTAVLSQKPQDSKGFLRETGEFIGTLGASAIAGVPKLAGGLASIVGADDAGRWFDDVGRGVQEALTPQSVQDKVKYLGRLLEDDAVPTTEVAKYVASNPDLWAYFGGEFIGAGGALKAGMSLGAKALSKLGAAQKLVSSVNKVSPTLSRAAAPIALSTTMSLGEVGQIQNEVYKDVLAQTGDQMAAENASQAVKEAPEVWAAAALGTIPFAEMSFFARRFPALKNTSYWKRAAKSAMARGALEAGQEYFQERLQTAGEMGAKEAGAQGFTSSLEERYASPQAQKSGIVGGVIGGVTGVSSGVLAPATAPSDAAETTDAKTTTPAPATASTTTNALDKFFRSKRNVQLEIRGLIKAAAKANPNDPVAAATALANSIRTIPSITNADNAQELLAEVDAYAQREMSNYLGKSVAPAAATTAAPLGAVETVAPTAPAPVGSPRPTAASSGSATAPVNVPTPALTGSTVAQAAQAAQAAQEKATNIAENVSKQINKSAEDLAAAIIGDDKDPLNVAINARARAARTLRDLEAAEAARQEYTDLISAAIQEAAFAHGLRSGMPAESARQYAADLVSRLRINLDAEDVVADLDAQIVAADRAIAPNYGGSSDPLVRESARRDVGGIGPPGLEQMLRGITSPRDAFAPNVEPIISSDRTVGTMQGAGPVRTDFGPQAISDPEIGAELESIIQRRRQAEQDRLLQEQRKAEQELLNPVGVAFAPNMEQELESIETPPLSPAMQRAISQQEVDAIGNTGAMLSAEDFGIPEFTELGPPDTLLNEQAVTSSITPPSTEQTTPPAKAKAPAKKAKEAAPKAGKYPKDVEEAAGDLLALSRTQGTDKTAKAVADVVYNGNGTSAISQLLNAAKKGNIGNLKEFVARTGVQNIRQALSTLGVTRQQAQDTLIKETKAAKKSKAESTTTTQDTLVAEMRAVPSTERAISTLVTMYQSSPNVVRRILASMAGNPKDVVPVMNALKNGNVAPLTSFVNDRELDVVVNAIRAAATKGESPKV